MLGRFVRFTYVSWIISWVRHRAYKDLDLKGIQSREGS